MSNQVLRFAGAIAAALLLAAGLTRSRAVEPLLAQGGPPCALVRLDKVGAIAPIAGGSFPVTVFPDPANCDFGVSVPPPELGTITKSGSTATVTVPANPAGSPARAALFEIGDQVFRVVQAGASALTPWHIGDVFVGAGSDVASSGVYKTLAPQGTPKLDIGSATPTNVVADLLDGAGYYSSGCMVDPTAAGGNHLFTASWRANTLSIFDGETHQLRDVFALTDPRTVRPEIEFNVGVLAGLPFETPQPLPQQATGIRDNSSTTLDEFVPADIQAFEQVVFANNGEFYVGTQTPPTDNSLGLGHGYLLRFRYAPLALEPGNRLVLTGWWKLDAGAIADRTAEAVADPRLVNGTSNGASGVDQFDLSSDQQTIFYTSEDGYIRRFNVATGTQGADILIKNTDNQPLGVRAYGIRILHGPLDPDGVPSAGFIVATDANMVVRLDRNGKLLTRYPVAGQPFALNLTPDAQYFWTAAQNDGTPHRFHIASGAAASFPPVATGAFGLCVKREYSAATSNGQCFNENPADGPYGTGTSACRTPPICTALGTDDTGAPNPDCFPPGFTRPVFESQENHEGDAVALDFNRPGFKVALVGLAQIPGLSFADGLVTGTIEPEACVPVPVDPAGFRRCEFTLTVKWSLESGTDGMPGGVTPFTWTIFHGNASPVLRNPGPIVLEAGQVLPAFSCIGKFMAMLGCAATPIVTDPDEATDSVHVFTTGLPVGLVLPSFTSYGNGWHLPLTGTAPTTLGPELGKFNVTITVCDDGGLIRNSAGAPIMPLACDPTSTHTRTETFLIHVNARPTLNSVAQLTQVPLVGPATYQLVAADTAGDPLTYQLVNPAVLPPWLTWNASTHTFTATPTLANAGAFVPGITVRVTDAQRATAETTFSWRVNRAPVLAIPSPLTFLVGTSTSHVVNATDSAGDALTYTPDSITYSGGSTQWVSWTDNGTSRTLTVAPTAADAGSSATIKVRVTDQWGGTTIATALWFATANNPPVCSDATATPGMIWPPNHKLVPFSINNVTDSDGDRLTIAITSITQDQPVNGKGDGNTGSDATGLGASSGAVRAERTGHLRVPGDGRLYQVNFTARDGKPGGTCAGTVLISVPHDQGQRNLPTDNGCRWDSITGAQLGPCAWLNAPVLTLSNLSNVAGTAINLQVTATDPDGTPLTYSATSLPPGLAMSSSGLITGTLAPVPGGAKSKKYTVTVNVSDGFGTVKSTFTWTVTRP